MNFIETEGRIPELSVDLIEMLDKLIPLKGYDLSLTKEENIYYSGQREVIEGLLLQLENLKD